MGIEFPKTSHTWVEMTLAIIVLLYPTFVSTLDVHKLVNMVMLMTFLGANQ